MINVCAAIITNNREVLCLQRGNSRYPYIAFKYEFPGGKIETGETGAQALKRELIEELSLTLDITEQDYYMTVHHRYPDFELTMKCYLVEVDHRNISSNEHVHQIWLPFKDLKQLDWAAADYPIVEHLMEGNYAN